jgi:uncharacterized protein DUF4154
MRWVATGMLGLALLLGGSNGLGQNPPPTEYQVKAAYLFNFARFVEWPAAALPKPDSPLIIGVVGENPFHDDLQKTIENKKIADHPVVAREFRSASEATNCHILFISSSEKARLPQIIKGLAGKSVLTVGETDGFNENGGMIKFFLEEGHVRFRINNDAAKSEGLKISSRLLIYAPHS